MTVTPLQLTNAYTALADGGTLYAPRLGEALVSPSGKVVQRISAPVIGTCLSRRRRFPISGQRWPAW